MKVEVLGVEQEWQRDMITDFVKWYSQTYIVVDTPDIEIQIVAIEEDEGVEYCADVMEKSFAENAYVITIYEDDTMTSANLIRSLAHEMTHVKQFVKGELFYNEDNSVTFNGEYFTSDSIDTESYFELPWEIEANGMERAALHRFADEFNVKELLIQSRYD